MQLSGKQIKETQEALLDAFPAKDELRMMVRIELDETLDGIVDGANQRVVIFNLVTWAERNGRTNDLVQGAYNHNPGSPALRRLMPAWRGAAPRWQAVGQASARAGATTTIGPVSIDFDWVTVPAGEFLMGSDRKTDKWANDDELPQHSLYLPKYQIARVPVTVAQFAAFVQATGYRTTAEIAGSATVWEEMIMVHLDLEGADWSYPRGRRSSVEQIQAHPVTCVSWYDAQQFCRWAGVRLPTGAEWEKAARGTDGRIYPWGDHPPTTDLVDADEVDAAVDYDENEEYTNDGRGTTPVDCHPEGASPYGLLDMAGNVWEWTSSKLGDYPYHPSDGRESLSGRELRTMRGGSWNNSSLDYGLDFGVRCAVRLANHPDCCIDDLGFRVVFIRRTQ